MKQYIYTYFKFYNIVSRYVGIFVSNTIINGIWNIPTFWTIKLVRRQSAVYYVYDSTQDLTAAMLVIPLNKLLILTTKRNCPWPFCR